VNPSPQRDTDHSLDRAAALARGAPPVPSNFIFWVLGAVLVLSLGGLAAERLFASAGLNPNATTATTGATTTTAANGATPAPSTRTADPPPAARSLGAPLAAFMGLSTLPPHPAPAFVLTDQSGRSASVPVSGKVVVLTFFDAPCNDICPVLASEIERADADLGARASRVEFVTVNTDPAAPAPAALSAALGATGLDALPNWLLVTGPLPALNAVWKEYGVSISVDTKTGLEAHSDVMDFIDAGGVLRTRAVPFADQSTSGAYSLPTATVARWGRGIASTVEQVLGR